jgi:four helix bundle protein
MNEIQKVKPYDLEERTFLFAQHAIGYFKTLPRATSSIESAKQRIRAASSIGANFIEANEALSRKDFAMRVKICRKEAKEAIYWLRLSESGDEKEKERQALIVEATELMKIFGSIIEKTKR